MISHPDASIYHHPAWLRTLEKEYGQRCIGLACEDAQGELRAILPLFRTRGLPFNIQRVEDQFTGHRLSSLPRTPLAGPLSIDPEATVALLRTAVERARSEPGVRLQLKTAAPGLHGLVDGLVRTQWRVNYVRELPDDPGKLHFGSSRNHSRIKWSVDKATKSGVRVRAAQTEADLKAWYQLYLATMRYNVVPPRSYRLFAAAWESMQPRGFFRLLLAEQHQGGREELLAGSVFLMFGRTVFYTFNGCSHKGFALRCNDLIQWQALHDACREGFRWYDLGEVPPEHEELTGFKSKWGSEARTSYRYYYPALSESEDGRQVTPGQTRYVARVWRRLPLAATARLGEWLYRYL